MIPLNLFFNEDEDVEAFHEQMFGEKAPDSDKCRSDSSTDDEMDWVSKNAPLH